MLFANINTALTTAQVQNITYESVQLAEARYHQLIGN